MRVSFHHYDNEKDAENHVQRFTSGDGISGWAEGKVFVQESRDDNEKDKVDFIETYDYMALLDEDSGSWELQHKGSSKVLCTVSNVEGCYRDAIRQLMKYQGF